MTNENSEHILGKQADLALSGVFQKILSRPHRDTIKKLIISDFHHVNGHLTGDKLDAFSPSRHDPDG